MREVELSEAEAQLVERGEAVTLTRGGVAVAKLAPVPERDQQAIDQAVAELKTFAKGNRLDGLSIRDLIDEGRR